MSTGIASIEKAKSAQVVYLVDKSSTVQLQEVDFNDINFSKIDALAKTIPASATASPATLAQYFQAILKPHAMNDLPAPSNTLVPFFRLLFIWCADYISYDVRWFTNRSACGPQTADHILKTRLGVCEAYANLFVAVCEAAGIDKSTAWRVDGCAKGMGWSPGHSVIHERTSDGKPSGHAWCAVKLNGRPYILDATWGGGSVAVGPNGYYFRRKVEDYYFLMDPRNAIYTHLPSEPFQQYLKPAFSEAEYLDLPFVKCSFFDHHAVIDKGVTLVNGSTLEIPPNTDGSVTLHLYAPEDDEKPDVKTTMRIGLTRDSRGNPSRYSGRSFNGVFVRYDGIGPVQQGKRVWVITLVFRLPEPGEAIVNFFIDTDKDNVDASGYPEENEAGSFLIRSRDARPHVPFPEMYASMEKLELALSEPTTSVLRVGTQQKFVIRQFYTTKRPLPAQKLLLVPPGPLVLSKAVEFRIGEDKARGIREYVADGVNIASAGDWRVGFQQGNQVDFVVKFTAN